MTTRWRTVYQRSDSSTLCWPVVSEPVRVVRNSQIVKFGLATLHLVIERQFWQFYLGNSGIVKV